MPISRAILVLGYHEFRFDMTCRIQIVIQVTDIYLFPQELFNNIVYVSFVIFKFCTMEHFEISSFSEFIDTVEDKQKNEIMLFRGQSDDDPLLPRIARKNPFRDTTDVEKKMISDLARRSNEFVQANMKNEWDWLALGQHYGLSTRLLDWTTNPLIALWFACCEEKPTGDYSVVWIYLVPDDAILDISEEKTPFSIGKTKVFQPNLVGKRLSTQLGWFTSHKYSINTKPNRFVGLEKNGDQKNNLFKIVIPKALRKKFVGILDTCGVNSSTIFPELDGLCQHINWIHLDE